ncbi:hypothetical protein [Halomicrobium salinisoli]|uniref:hypothetical protein n=1 Tax=Halomicrobium salinisoli TaxID=2878391 RepID=UPI001CF06F55|nr:hypothetical protein [Halomicrobium salinisoli]
MVFEIVLSGAVSAILGAIAIKIADSFAERRKLIIALHAELLLNQSKLAGEIYSIRNRGGRISKMGNRLSDRAFQTLRTSNPRLFLKLTDEIGSLRPAYSTIESRISDFETVNEAGSHFDAEAEEIAEEYTGSVIQIQEAARGMEEYVKESWLRRLMYSPILVDEEENKVPIEDL